MFDPYEMFSGGGVFVVHYSGFMGIKNQVSINDTYTINYQLIFEKCGLSQVVIIKGYHTYNGIFNASNFMEDLLKKKNILVLVGMAYHTKMVYKSKPSRQWLL